MEKLLRSFAAFVVRRRRALIAVWAALAVAGAAASRLVAVDYDLSGYLPVDMSSKIGADYYQEEFDIVSTAMLMTSGMADADADALEKWLEERPGVSEVLGYTDVADTVEPEWFVDPKLAETFLRGENRLYVIKFSNSSQDEITRQALSDIAAHLSGQTYALGGDAAFSATLMQKANDELPVYTAIAVVALLLVVMLAMESWVEPVLLLCAIGAAIFANLGSNLIMGRISMISNSAAPLLQLAVSMDYAIFLLHRYHQEKEAGLSPADAMEAAVRKSFVSIGASAATTIAGFMALLFMRYGVGADMGLVLSKGVLLSILSTLTLLPGLILASDRLIERTRHRAMLPGFRRLGSALVRMRYAGLVLGVLLIIPFYLAQRNVTYLYSSQNTLYTDAQVNIDNERIEQEFDRGSEIILLVPDGDPVRLEAFMQALRGQEAVRSVSGYTDAVDSALPDLFIPAQVKEAYMTQDGHTALTVVLSTGVEDEKTHAAVTALREMCEQTYPGQWYMTGTPAIYRDLAVVTGDDFRRVTLFSVVLIVLILAVAFRSLSLPVILVACIESAIWINLGYAYFAGQSLFFITAIIINAVQLGASVDYAILFTGRYRENLERTADRRQAMIWTFRDAGGSILTSALTLFAATSTILFVSTIRTTNEIMNLMARGSLLSMGMVFIALPGLLMLADPVIRRTTWGWPTRRTRPIAPKEETQP
jgi:predicted RND superfamily exporter protein